jgi:hypothetical protein
LVGCLVSDALEVLAFELGEPDAVGGVGDVEIENGPDEREGPLDVDPSERRTDLQALSDQRFLRSFFN